MGIAFKDLSGRTFGKLKVIKRDYSRQDNKIYWLCKCECKRLIIMRGDRLVENKEINCPECSFENSRINLVGNVYGILTVIKRLEDRSGHWWLCKCGCGNKKFKVSGNRLESGKVEDCGCVIRAKNRYDLTGTYGIGYTKKNEEFYFDLEDYEKIKGYTWCVSTGYIMSSLNGKLIQFHRVVTNASDDEIIDHISRNRKDNRKINLRFVTETENHRNTSLGKNNKSGFIGVSFDNRSGKWYSKIDVDYKQISLGRYEYLNDAVYARLCAEKEFYGEYAPQKHLYSQYGIEE